MSTQIPTYNIIVAFDKDVFINLKKSSESMSSFFSKNKKGVLFTNISSNFLRMAHTYSFTGGKEKVSDNFVIALEVLDPEKVFEGTYFINSINSLIASKGSLLSQGRIDKQVDDEISLLKSKLNKVITSVDNNDNNFVSELSEYSDDSVERELFDKNEKIKNLKSSNGGSNVDNKDQLQIQFENLRSEYITSIKTRLDQLEAGVSTPVYISYGCGSNLDGWAGPFLCGLQSARYDFSSETGMRSISLFFVCDGRWGGLTPIDNLSFGLGRDFQIFAQQEIIKIPETYKTSDSDPLESFRLSQLFSYYGKGKTSEEYYAEESIIDYHYVISECIRDYLSKCVNGEANVIVLFPDLNEFIAPLKKIIIESFSKAPFRPSGDNISIQNYDGSITKIPYTEMYAIPEICKQLGFEVTEEIVDNGKVISYDVEALIGKADPLLNAKQASNGWLNMGKSLYLSLVKKQGQSYIDPINNLVDKFPTASRQVLLPVMYVENNIDFIRDLKDVCENYKSSNPQDTNNTDISYSKRRVTIPTIDVTKPLLIYGDQTMIDRFFFGKNRLEKSGIFKFSFPSDTSLYDAKQNIAQNEDNSKKFDYNKLIATRDQLFGSDEYQKLSDKYFQTPKPDNCFNFNKLPKSQFSFNNNDANEIEKLNIPIFKFGVQDSNVLDVNMDINQHYFSHLASILYRTTNLFKSSDSVTNSLDESFNCLLKLDFNAMSSILQKFTLYNNGSTEINRDLIKRYKKYTPELQNANEEDIEAMLISLISLTETKTHIKNLEWWKSDDPSIHFLSILTYMSKIAYRGTIRTLPFFGLSTNVGSLNPVFLFINESSIIGLNKTSSVSNSLNGLWSVFGYEHVIDKNGAHSSFHITKDPRYGFPAGLTPILKDSIPTEKVGEL